MSGEPKVDILGASIKTILAGRPEAEVAVREGLIVEMDKDGSYRVHSEGKTYGPDDLPPELESEILAAAKEHGEVISTLEGSKYVDPKTNPMIKTEED